MTVTNIISSPWIADKYGRRLPIVIGCVIMIVGAIICGVCNGYGMYVGGRFLLGFGNSLAQLASPVLITEIAHPQHRARVSAVYNCLWNVGAVFVAWMAWGTMQINGEWSWRSITILQGLPSLIQIMGIWWVPESPRWLIANDRPDEALKILAYYHANGDEKDKTVQYEWIEIKETLAMEASVKGVSYMEFFRTRGNRYRLMLLVALGVISQYSGNAIISNYSSLIYEGAGITDSNQKIPLNGGQFLMSLFVGLIAATTVDKIGRRKLFLTATTGMLAMFFAWTITSAQYHKTQDIKSSGYPQIAFIWLYSFFYAFAWSGLLTAYSLEILPYHLRAKGIMIMNLTVQAILALGNQTNPIAWDNMPQPWNLAAFYTVWLSIELAFVYFFFVETKGIPLEELAKIFDGEDAVAHVQYGATEKDNAVFDHNSDLSDTDARKNAAHAQSKEL